MESLPVGWTVYTCDQEGDRAGLLTGGVYNANANPRVCDLFHEDAQVCSESRLYLICGPVIIIFGLFIGIHLSVSRQPFLPPIA